MNRYRLLAGKHVEAGREFAAGAIVTSPFPLDRLFAGKFEALPAAAAPRKPADDAPRKPAERSAAAGGGA